MNKKYSYIPLSEISKEPSGNIKNNQIPRPKNSMEILNPMLIYKKGRNINNKRNNIQNDSSTNENYYSEKNNLNNSNTFISCISNNNNANANITNGDSGIFDLLINLSINNNLIKKSINNKRNDIKEEKDEGEDEELKKKIECDLIEEKIKKAQKDMENVKNNIEKLNKKMIDMKNDLNNLNLQKNENKKELENLISNKETLEEMYNMELLFIKKDSSITDDNNNINNCNINILIEDLENININQFKKQIIELMCQLYVNDINNINNNSLYESTSNQVIDNYTLFIQRIKNEPNCSNKIISEFFINISKIISKENMGKNKLPLSSIISLLHYLIKINYINQKIENFEMYNKNEYKTQKQEINQQLIELTMSLIFFENQKHEILILSSKLKEQLKNLKEKDQNKMATLNNKNIENNIKNNSINDNNDKEKENKIIEEKENMDKKSNKSNKSNKSINEEESFQNAEKKNNKNGGNNINNYNLIINDDFSDREKVKNKIFENYINNGIALNSIKKKKNKKYKIYNFNSISDNRSKDKIINDKSNYSSSFNYNFNTNLFDVKRNKKNDSNIENDKKNILKLKNSYDLNGSKIFKSNVNTKKRKLNNGNDELNIFNFTQFSKLMTNFDSNKNRRIVSKKSNDKKKNYRRYLNKKVISKSKSKLKPNKSHLMNSESFFTNYKKQNYHRLSNFQKYLARSFTNSSHDLNKNYKSMNNIKNTKSNLNNMNSKNNLLKSFHSKIKNVSNNFINYIDNISTNKSNINNNRSNNSNSNIYLGKIKKNIFNNINNIYTENKSLKFSILNYRQKKLMKLNENKINNSHNVNNISNISGINCHTAKNKVNGFYSMSSELDNQLKIFKQGEMESFCYYKIIDKNINKFNPLNDYLVNPEHLGYYECYISIDVVSGCIKISPKISIDKMENLPKSEFISVVNNKENEFYMNIKLKEIFNIHVEKYMKNIIKIQNILLKYNYDNKNVYNNGSFNINNNNIRVNKIFSINKIINKKEISEIKIEQNEKIKAALCNFFSFSFSFGNKSNLSSMKIDLVFINFEQFNIWLNTLDSIVKNNVKSNKISILSNYNSASIQKFKIKSINNYKTAFSNNSENNQLRTKSRMQSNNIVKTTGIQGKKIISFYK